MLVSFRIDAPGLEGAAFLVERTALDASGDLESGFFAGAGRIERHRGNAAGALAARLAAAPGIEAVVLIRNPGLVLDEGLPARIAAARARLAPLAGRWSLAAAAGLTVAGGRVSALYASATPHLPLDPHPNPLHDALPDLTLVDAAWLSGLAGGGRTLPDTALEPLLIAEGYRHGRVALYLPELVASVHGGLRARDPARLGHELGQWFGDSLPGEVFATLSGPVAIAPAAGGPGSPNGAGEQPREALQEAAERAIDALCDPLSLSIVTRTRFTRPHLLERLLASITRARRAAADIEVVLSSDTPRATCEAALEDLRGKFANLRLRLQRNPPEGHSRVTNLLAGIRAATGDYVAVVDDDDHVDLFAFGEMRRALFLGARPLMVTASAAHDEEWTETPSGRHVLARRTQRATYPACGWRRMFGGVNRLPVCALIVPRERLVARLDAFAFRHDLSEDYTLNLLVLSDPALPEVVELPGIFGHISIRPGEGHSMTFEDRRPWARDIALYLADLTRCAAVAGPGKWALLAGRETAQTVLEAKNIAELQAALADRDRELRLMRREIEQLRAARPAPGAAPADAAA
ncbi:MAG TPA: glycosyltransferase [Thermohalobaculum sp.]|nr:glycosyltransferase [Thermohalobaculum sp.]